VAKSFPAFTLCNCPLVTVNQLKCLGHIIDNSFSDDIDIKNSPKRGLRSSPDLDPDLK